MFSSDTPIAVLEYASLRCDLENIVWGVSVGMLEFAAALVLSGAGGTPV